jgi:hypothetical protein
VALGYELKEVQVSHTPVSADEFPPDSYASWCRRNGDHSTTAHQNVNWNTEIIWKMCIETALQWELLEDEIPTVFEKLAKDLRKALTEFKENAILRKYLSWGDRRQLIEV